MKRFVVHISLFLLFSLLILSTLEFFKYRRGVHDDTVCPEVYQAIDNSKESTEKFEYLILGDSMGMQLYPCTKEYSNIYSLTCNRAILMAGHYFLLNNYFCSNPLSLPDTIIFILNPYSFRAYNDEYTFNYFLKPFYTKEYTPLYTESLWDSIRQIPFWWLSQAQFVRTTNWTVSYFGVKNPLWHMISPISHEYLMSIVELAESYSIKLTIVSPPLSDVRQDEYENMWNEGNMYGEMVCLENYLNCYHDSFHFFPDSLFIDGIHLKNEYIPEDYLGILP